MPETFEALCHRVVSQAQEPDLKQEFLNHVEAFPPLDAEWFVLIHHAMQMLANRKPEDAGESA